MGRAPGERRRRRGWARATPRSLRYRLDQLRWLGRVGKYAGAAHPIHQCQNGRETPAASAMR
jgi:hypothetical protein